MSGKKAVRHQSSSTFSCRVLATLVVFVVIAVVMYLSRHPTTSFAELKSNFPSYEQIFTEIDQNSQIHNELQAIPISKGTVSEVKFHFTTQTKKNPDPQIMTSIKDLRQRCVEFLQWVTNDGPFIRWDLISKADIHIAYKVVQYIDFYLETPEKQLKLEYIYKYGIQCNTVDAMRQELVARFISMDICSEVEWYKLLHLAWPEARTFLDVGGNKGYLGSLFLTLWGGGLLHAAPAELFKIAKEQEAWKSSRNPMGYCKDGAQYGISMYCPTGVSRDPNSGSCSQVNSDVRIFSMDGSSYLAETLTSIIQKFPPHNELSASNMWSYRNYAVSDTVGTARFTKQSKDKNPGFEGGGIRGISSSKQLDDSEEEVPMITVDHFMQLYNLTRVDLLKIDTEGNDNKVLRGAKKALASSVGMFAFEGGKGVTFSKDMIESLDNIGFSCYSTSRAGLFKWNAQCTKERYMGGFAAKDKGNIFCISRQRAPLAAFAFDILTFTATFQLLMDSEWISRQKDKDDVQQLQALSTAINVGNITESGSMSQLSHKTNPAFLLPAYVNIYGFCKPWPACAKRD